jgi:hypothetical protein
MDHLQATNMNAAEQYLLGELSEELRADFEEHFMSCAECARDIRAAAVFMESTREVLREESLASVRTAAKPERKRGFWATVFQPMIAAPAMAILIAALAYQSFVAVPRLKTSLSDATAPRTLAAFSLINANSRGGAATTFTVAKDQPFALYIDVPPQPPFPTYTLDVETSAGAPQFTVAATADQAKNTLQILVPASRLKEGQYALVVRGSSGPNDTQETEVASFPFAIQYTQSTNHQN